MPAAPTASPEEVARFTAMAEQWWDPRGKFRPLHVFNPVRLAFLKRELCRHFDRDPSLAAPFTGLSLLDVGCGGGLLSEPMARMGFAVTGIDAGEKNVAVAAIHAEQSGVAVNYRVATPEQLEQGAFDVVMAMEVVEHVPDAGAFLAACAGALKPGGAFCGATISRTAKAWALAIVGAERVLRWLPPGTHDWKKFLKPHEFAALLRASGIETTGLTGLTYAPFSDMWSESKDLDVNYLIFGSKPST